jgi:hypothetical protein
VSGGVHVSLPRRLAPLLPVALTAAVYHPLWRVYFYADDYLCMYQFADGAGWRFLLQPFAGHILLARNLLFALWYRVFGFVPEPYYAAVLVTHLVNVWLFFRVLRSITDDLPLSTFGATPMSVGLRPSSTSALR